VTQNALAAMLRVSPKAVQSYEQGWRKLPWHLLSQMLVLLALRRGQALGRPPCWDVTGCSRRVNGEECPAVHIGEGRYCWLSAGPRCSRRGATACKAVPCETCEVITRLLRDASRATPAARRARRAPRVKAKLSERSLRKRRSPKKSEVKS